MLTCKVTAIPFLRESSSVAETDHRKPEPRIIGGQYVREKEFHPFILSIKYFKSHFCGGGACTTGIQSYPQHNALMMISNAERSALFLGIITNF